MSTLAFIERPSPNFDARARVIDLVVLHYTGMQDAEIALARLTDPAPVAGAYPGPWQSESAPADAPLGRVSTHYVVGEAGEIWRVVDEEERAWHAGVSSWEGEGDVNSRAIGIEIVNGGHDFGLPDFPDAQIDAVIALVRDILARRGLDASRVIAHSDIAPERKLDPGEKFPWKRLADAGASIWPASVPVATRAGEDVVGRVQAQLKRLGYSLEQSGAMDAPTRAALMAFQRRFRPTLIDGLIDEETQALLAGLALKQRTLNSPQFDGGF
ncbi:MAG: N-acetylmuramoyl-L-alanine amidase [Terricaulis sp.]|nr:N-acetylmuramoyl-L-alanine amidase [Terricaulis sp.]